MMNHGDYEYNEATDTEKYCGIKIINSKEQIALINRAALMSEPNEQTLITHQENYTRYETAEGEIKYGLKTQWMQEKPSGYCRIVNPKHGKCHSVSPFVSYNCANCLGTDLVYNRSSYPGLDCDIEITGSGPGIDVSKLEKVQFRFTRGVCEITFDQHGLVKTNNFVFVVRTGQKPLVKIFGCSRGNDVFYGTKVGTMLGLPICETILRGHQCKSLTREASTDFFVNSIPNGYPGWVELQQEYEVGTKKRPVGKIWVHRKCKRCTEFEPIKPNPTREIGHDNDMLKSRDKMIQTLMTENSLLREQYREALIELERLRNMIKPN